MKEIALFESYSIFQYLLLFTWFPAWGLTTLRQGSSGNITVQKSFLFSNLSYAIGILVLVFAFMMIAQYCCFIWPDMPMKSFMSLLALLVIYLISQAQVYTLYLQGKTTSQWYLAFINFGLWIFLAFYTKDFGEFLSWMVGLGGILVGIQVIQAWSPGIKLEVQFWREVFIYSFYLSIGAATVVVAGYYVMQRYGLQEELNWFRYGSRELPVIPAILAGYGQSFLVSKSANTTLIDLKESLPRYLKFFSPILFIILFSKPLFHIVYGNHFLPAATLMSTFLLIYGPRMIQSNIVLQSKDDRSSLLWIAGIELIVITVSMISIAPHFGIVSVIWILVAGTILEKLLQIIVLKVKYNIEFNAYVPLIPLTLWMIALVVAYLLHLWIV